MKKSEIISGKKVLVNSVIYSFSGLLIKCFSFFLLPLYTVYLSTEDYGINSLITSFISTMSFVVAFSLYSAVMRFYVEYKNEPKKLKRFYGTIIVFVFLSGCIFAVVLTLFKDFLSRYFFSGIDFYPIILVSLISLIFCCEYTVFDNILRSQQKALKSSICSIMFFLISIVLNIYFVVVRSYGALGTVLATMIGYIIYTTYFVIEMSIRKTIEFCIDFELLKEALKYSIPIMPHNLSTQIAMFISKIFIGNVSSLGSLGIYTVACQFGNIADTIQGYVDSAYGPWLYEKLHMQEEGYKKSIREIVKLLISVIGLFFLGISLFSHDYIVLFIEESYVGAWKFVPLIVTVFAIKTMYYFYVEILFYYKKASRKLFLATLTGSILNVLFSFFLIPVFGVYGSILADGIAMVVRVLIVFLISKEYDDIGLKICDFIINFIMVEVFILLGLALSYLKYQTCFSVINLIYKIVIIVLYVFFAAFINRRQVKKAIKNIKNKGKYNE